MQRLERIAAQSHPIELIEGAFLRSGPDTKDLNRECQGTSQHKAEKRHQNASEVLREGLRLLERRELEDAAKLEALRGALDEAEAAVVAGDLYDYSRTLLDTVEEEERASATQDSRI